MRNIETHVSVLGSETQEVLMVAGVERLYKDRKPNQVPFAPRAAGGSDVLRNAR